MATTIKSFEDRVPVQPFEAEQTTASGLTISGTAKGKPQEDRVVVTGPSHIDDKGSRVPPSVTESDIVILNKCGGTEVKYDGSEYLLPNTRDVLAIVSRRVKARPMARTLQFDEEARRSPEHGVNTPTNAVEVTLGPKGRYVVFDKEQGAPIIINDDVTVAREVELEGPYEDLGARLAKKVAAKASDVAGDGTTTATVLAQAPVHEGLRAVASGLNPVGLRRDIGKTIGTVVERLHENSRPVGTTADMANIATTSSRGEQIGRLIAEAFDKIGKDDVITVDESQTFDTELELTEGMWFNKGYLSPYFVADADRVEVILEDPYILINSGKISSMNGLLPLLERIIVTKGTLFMMAGDIDDETLSTLVVDRVRGTFTSAAIKAPAFGDRHKTMLEDIAILTDGRVIAPEVGLKLDQVGLEVFGRTRRVIVTKDSTIIVDGTGEQFEVAAHVAQLRAGIEHTDSDWDRKKLREYVAKPAGGVCVIKIGAVTEVELKEKRHRIEDVVSVIYTITKEGIVTGGGSAPIHAAKVLGSGLGLTSDERVGVAIICESAMEPLHWIAENGSGVGYVITSKTAGLEPGYGYNARTDAYENLIKTGIVDPVKIACSVLANAVSITFLLLTTETLVVEKKEDEGDK